MKGRQKNIALDEAPASIPQTTPAAIGYGHPEYQFVQAVMEMQKSIGEVKASVDSLRTVVESTRADVTNLVNWKHKILGGAAVLGAMLTLVGFLVSRVWPRLPAQPEMSRSQSFSNDGASAPSYISPPSSSRSAPSHR